MYYHQGDDSNSVYRLDVVNFNQLSNIDAGIQLDDNSGPAWGIGLIDGVIMASVASNGGSRIIMTGVVVLLNGILPTILGEKH